MARRWPRPTLAGAACPRACWKPPWLRCAPALARRGGPREFEVGAEVLQAFGEDPAAPDARRFVFRARPDGAARWLANLPRLAHERLAAAGVRQVSDAAACTVEQASAFFSFRRDGVTGRMAAAVWRC